LRAFSVGTLPSLLPAILQASSLVFLFCYFSFTIILVFGGRIGSTPEVEIYRLLKLEADPATALAVAVPETIIAVLCLFFMARMERRAQPGGPETGAATMPSRLRGRVLLMALTYAVILVVCFLGPLVSLVWRAFEPGKGAQAHTSAFQRLLMLPGSPLYPAILDTLTTAIPAALLATIAGTVVARIRSATAAQRPAFRVLDTLASLPMAISQVLMAFGWGLLFPRGGILPIVLAQASSAFPFVYRSMAGVFASLDAGPLLAARTLGAKPMQRFFWVELPMSLPVLTASGAFAFAMAAGDVNAALVLGAGRFQSLPVLLFRLVGAYRFGEACAVGLILAVLCAVVFLFKENLPDGA
jgi:thiamine transport system permease protein